MGIGHVAVGLGLKRADREINVGWLIFAALLPDFLLGWFALAGWESYYEAPAGYAASHYLLFTFPWSHGLLSDGAWGVMAGLITFWLVKRRSAAVAVAMAVWSHFLLDGIVHVKGLPVAGTGSPVFGLGLWRHLSVELSLEAAMAAAGLWIYLTEVRKRGRSAGIGMAVYTVVLGILLIAGQVGGTELPSRGALIAGWLTAPLAMAGIAVWLDRKKMQ